MITIDDTEFLILILTVVVAVIGYVVRNEHRLTMVETVASRNSKSLSRLERKIDLLHLHFGMNPHDAETDESENNESNS